MSSSLVRVFSPAGLGWHFHRCSNLVLAGLLLALAISATLTAQPVTLLDDTFADGDRTTQNLPGSLAWYANTPRGVSSVGPGALNVNGDVADAIYWGYFPVLTLRVGESLTLSLDLRFGTPPILTGTGIIAGLFHSNGVPHKTVDGTAQSGPFRGYVNTINTLAADAGMRVRKRSGISSATAGILSINDLDVAPNLVTFGAERSVRVAALQPTTSYHITLKVMRTGASTALLTAMFAGDGLGAATTVTETDIADIFATFDTIAIRLGSIRVQGGSATISRVTLTHETARLNNLSVRTGAGSGAQTLIVGFSVRGGNQPLIVRGIGPGLAAFGVGGTLVDPKLELYNAAAVIIYENDNWLATDGAAFASVGAFPLPDTSRDAAFVASLSPGSYSAQVTGVGGTSGLALVELYERPGGQADARLTNVSARCQVGTGGDIVITGFSLVGAGQRTLLIRAIGPGLFPFGVPGALADPKLELYTSGSAQPIAQNDNWDGSADVFEQVGAFNLPTGSKDAVLRVTLDPGRYTAQVSGVGGTTGVALVEVYEVP